MNALHPTIATDPRRRSGRPRVRDLRISVGDVLGWMARGQSPEDIAAHYPELTLDDLCACLACAAERELRGVRLAASRHLFTAGPPPGLAATTRRQRRRTVFPASLEC